jgi:hypothetical protein
MFKIGDKVKRVKYAGHLVIGKVYTVDAVSSYGRYIGVSEYHSPDNNTPFEAANFELVADANFNTTSAVVEWLNKLQWLHHNVTHILGFNTNIMILSTDFGDVNGTDNIAKYVNGQYNVHMQAKKVKRKESLLQELQEKEAEVAKLKAELEAI